MVFNAALPADETKIRDIGVVIRPNWAAINTADETFAPAAINLSNQGGALGAFATQYRLFSDSDATTAYTELFGVNSNGDVQQITNGSPTKAATGSTFLPGGLVLAWGQSATGAVAITIAAMTTIYQVVATVNDTSPTPGDRNIAINSKAGNQFTVYSSSSGQVNWIAIGI